MDAISVSLGIATHTLLRFSIEEETQCGKIVSTNWLNTPTWERVVEVDVIFARRPPWNHGMGNNIGNSAGFTIDLKSAQEGKRRLWKALRRAGALCCENSASRKRISASVELETDGFSRRTCLPTRIERSTHSKCNPFARGMKIQSISGSSSISV